MRWDIFCRVIDNHGDVGVCWRVARELAERGEQVRLWIDDAAPLAWMAPGGHARVQVLPWPEAAQAGDCGDVVVEAFGCDPPAAFVALMAQATRHSGRQPPWLNLEYLSAEPYVERNHGLPSPVSTGPGAGLVKHFVYPGFTPATGGLLRERDLASRQASFDAPKWLRAAGVPEFAGQRISLFCYEPAVVPALLRQLAAGNEPTQLLVTAGRATDAVRLPMAALAADPAWNRAGRLALHWLPLLTQRDYDHLLWSCDFNFVRGEDSAVRALWAGRPWAWQLYPQDDQAHAAKLEAFLDWLQPPAELAALHRAWNGLSALPLPALRIADWRATAEAARSRALDLPELVGTLLGFATTRATM